MKQDETVKSVSNEMTFKTVIFDGQIMGYEAVICSHGGTLQYLRRAKLPGLHLSRCYLPFVKKIQKIASDASKPPAQCSRRPVMRPIRGAGHRRTYSGEAFAFSDLAQLKPAWKGAFRPQSPFAVAQIITFRQQMARVRAFKAHINAPNFRPQYVSRRDTARRQGHHSSTLKSASSEHQREAESEFRPNGLQTFQRQRPIPWRRFNSMKAEAGALRELNPQIREQREHRQHRKERTST